MSNRIRTHRFTRVLLAAAAAALGAVITAPSAQAAPMVYNANVPRLYTTSSTDPLYFQVQNSSRTMFDDVPVNVTGLVNPTVTVTRVTFDVTQVANAPGTTVTAYYAPMVADSLQFGGNPASDSSALDDPGAPVSIGSISLNSTSNYTRTTFTIGNGTTPLFTVPLDTAQNPGGPGYFFLGLKFSDTTDKTGWTIADPGPVNANGYAANGNIDALFDYASATSFDEFTYGQDGNTPPQDIAGAQMMTVEGFVVPEPASATILVLCGVFALARRRAIH